MNSLILLAFTAAAQTGDPPELNPSNTTVSQGSTISFNCSTSQQWSAMTWMLNTGVALTISEEHGILGTSGRYTARNHTTSSRATWEFFIRNVTKSDSGLVTCDLQDSRWRKAELDVQVVGTVDIAEGSVTLPVGKRATLHCSATGWSPQPHIEWVFNDTAVVESSCNTSTAHVGDLVNTISSLSFRPTGSSWVTCLVSVTALAKPLSRKVFLTVDEEHAGKDPTVIIAACVAAALLVLVLILIIACCRRKVKGNGSSQKETRTNSLWCTGNDRHDEFTFSISRYQEKSQSGGTWLGQVNNGFSLDSSPDNQIEKAMAQMFSTCGEKVADIVKSSRGRDCNHGNSFHTLPTDGAKTVRHATIV